MTLRMKSAPHYTLFAHPHKGVLLLLEVLIAVTVLHCVLKGELRVAVEQRRALVLHFPKPREDRVLAFPHIAEVSV